MSADSVRFSGRAAERLWDNLKSRATQAIQTDDLGKIVLGTLLLSVMEGMESSLVRYNIDARDFSDQWENNTGGGQESCTGANQCHIEVDTNPRGTYANINSMIKLAHEAGEAFLWSTAGVDHYSKNGAIMVENFARFLVGCGKRVDHSTGGPACP